MIGCGIDVASPTDPLDEAAPASAEEPEDEETADAASSKTQSALSCSNI